MSGHGHVTPNADGSKARCGGPGVCPQCSVEKASQRTRPVFGLSEADHREAFLTVPLYYAAINERDIAEALVTRLKEMWYEEDEGIEYCRGCGVAKDTATPPQTRHGTGKVAWFGCVVEMMERVE